MKNKLLALLASIGMISSVSAVEVIENVLSVGGFIDGSYINNDIGGDTSAVAVDEVEVQISANVGNVSGEVHIDNNDGAAADDLSIEQAHFTYSLENGLSITFGRYASALGLEREDPAGLYTFSRAYGQDALNLGNVDVNSYEGIALGYASGDLALNLSLDQATGTADLETEDLNYELSASYTGIENLVATLGYRTNNADTAADDTEVINLTAAYTVDKLLIAGELTAAEISGEEVDGYLFLVDYDITEKLGAAIRYSNEELLTTTNPGGGDASTLTVAPNYAVTDSFGIIVEYSDIDSDAAAQDGNQLAVELTYTF